MCSFFNSFFTVIGSNTVCSKKEIGNRNVDYKLLIVVFQISSVSCIGSAVFRETSNNLFSGRN